MAASRKRITTVLLDVTGVLYESGAGGGKVIDGSPQAVQRYAPKVSECAQNDIHTG